MDNIFVQLLEMLYRERYSQIYRSAYERLGDAFAAEDAVEEVFIAIISHQVWWTKQNESVRFDYVMKTCESVCHKMIENREKIRFIEYEEKTVENEDGRMEKQVEQSMEALEYLENLSELDKKIFEERYYGDCTVKEIAHLNDMSENNVSKHLSKGKNKILGSIKKMKNNGDGN